MLGNHVLKRGVTRPRGRLQLAGVGRWRPHQDVFRALTTTPLLCSPAAETDGMSERSEWVSERRGMNEHLFLLYVKSDRSGNGGVLTRVRSVPGLSRGTSQSSFQVSASWDVG